MPQSLANHAASSHRLLPETAGRMAKADLRKAETADEWRVKVGQAVRRCRALSGLTLKEFAAVLVRDERQISRWESGDERAQVDVILRAELLRKPWLQAQAEMVGAGVDIVLRFGAGA